MSVIYIAVAVLLVLSWGLSLFALYMLGQASLARAQMESKAAMMQEAKAAWDSFLSMMERRKEDAVSSEKVSSGKRAARKKAA